MHCIALLSAVRLATTAPVFAQGMSEAPVRVGGPAMLPTRTIVANAVKAAGLVDTLNGKGPFTVFAPTNEAFDDLPKGTVDNLEKPESKAMLTKILTVRRGSGCLLRRSG